MTQSVRLRKSGDVYRLGYHGQRCPSCILSEQFPDITFDEDGVCSYCRAPEAGAQVQSQNRSLADMRADIANPDGGVDVVHLFSGGKDSTFALSQLVSAGFRVHAMTYDNGFLAPQTFRNIERTASLLGVDHVIRRIDRRASDDLMRAGLSGHDNVEALKYATASCGLCISTVLSLGAAEARSVGARFLSGGWTPGQFTYDPIVPGGFLAGVCSGHFNSVSLRDPDLRRRLDKMGLTGSDFPPLFNPLYVSDYHEARVLEHLDQLGWRRPARMDSCSSNCMLNGYLVLDHALRHGFHPYEYELAHHVRTGRLTRREALDKIENVSVPVATAHAIAARLGMTLFENEP